MTRRRRPPPSPRRRTRPTVEGTSPRPTIRLAEPAELGEAYELLHEVMHADPDQMPHIPETAPEILAATTHGPKGFQTALAHRLSNEPTAPSPDPPAVYTVVAVEADTIVSAALFGPPLRLIQEVQTTTTDPRRQQMMVALGLMGISKLYAVRTLDTHQRHGIGNQLIRRGLDIFLNEVGGLYVYGNCSPTLTRWYQHQGFTVGPADEPLTIDPGAVFGFPVSLSAGPGECMFRISQQDHRRHPRPR